MREPSYTEQLSLTGAPYGFSYPVEDGLRLIITDTVAIIGLENGKCSCGETGCSHLAFWLAPCPLCQGRGQRMLKRAELVEAMTHPDWQPDLCPACDATGWVPAEELKDWELVALAQRGERDKVAA